jgi:small-conductance mechanosensitive channel
VEYQDFFSQVYFENAVKDWLTAAGLFMGVCLLLYGCKSLIAGRLCHLFKMTGTHLDDACLRLIGGISVFFYIAVAFYAATKHLLLPNAIDGLIYAVFVIALVYEGVQFLQKFTLFFLQKVWLKDNVHAEHVSHIFGIFIKVALWAIGLLLILSNLGFEVSSLVASLGIGGIALALAVQNILGDIFNSFSIYLDRPFQVGDFIVVGQHMGTVKKIGLKSTRLEALQGEEIVISNSELTSARIQNFKHMQKRRIAFPFGVTYDTPHAKIAAIPGMVREIVEGVGNTQFDRAHFKSFADSSLDFEVVYYLLSSDYNTYMDTQQAINLGLIERFAKEGIEFAFPTRTVHLVKA